MEDKFSDIKRFDETFKSKLSGFDFDTIENSDHVIFGLSEKLELIYFNPAWFRFAALNGGEPSISANYPLGTSIENALSGDVKEYYIENIKNVFKDLRVWKHICECSSPDNYRLFYQEVYPLKNGEGVIIVNSLKMKLDIDESFTIDSAHPLNEYIGSNGIITQCSNCRKTKRMSTSLDIWDWVPAFVIKMPENVSHSICPVCYDYYWKYNKSNDMK